MTIGERIKARRDELGMSQEELAHKIGYKSKTSINKIELGIQELRQSKIKQIADALQTTPAYIMGWKETEEDQQLKSVVNYSRNVTVQMLMMWFPCISPLMNPTKML